MFWNIESKISNAIHFCDDTAFSLAGRVLSFRKMGGVSFGHISDQTGKMQFCIKRSDFENYTDVVHQIKMGVHIGISGVIWTSSTGEKTLLVKSFKLLQTPQKGFPDKWNGISDEEVRLRKRYLDTSFNIESRNVFVKRSQIISAIRNFLNERDFIEFQTPIMSAAASGAMAKPFVTHHNSLDADLYLRIAPETFLKRIVGGGFDRVYEIGTQFRNEGFSKAHLQEFTTIEWYAAYFDYMDNLNMFEDLLKNILNSVCGSTKIKYGDVILNFENIEVASYSSLFQKHLNIDISNYSGDLDLLFKKEIRPNLIQPIFVKDYPSNMVPLSDVNSDGNAEMWQLIVNGWELVKCYTELVDPAKQRINFEQQANEKSNGNDEAMVAEEEFLEAMEYGMPPMSGLGLGIDRLVCILTNQQSLRDVVYFPLMLEKN